ncbi:TMhelix containing protein [Vibrio phage 1.081.O._10N.286.52.C2]|nr:TMhelix containing protein [Vibrio phage 1.081.O._10N.286.52.C2]
MIVLSLFGLASFLIGFGTSIEVDARDPGKQTTFRGLWEYATRVQQMMLVVGFVGTMTSMFASQIERLLKSDWNHKK